MAVTQLPCVPHPEHAVTSDTYLNLYAGMEDKIELENFECYQTMTEEERKTFDDFLKSVQSPVHEGKFTAIVPDKFTVLRFLQADQYDTTKAMTRLESNQEWLRQVNIPGLLQNPPKMLNVYRKLRSRSCMGRTQDGMPIFVERLGDFINAIPSKEGKSFTKQDWVDCFLYEMGGLLGTLRDSYDYNLQNKQPVTWKATWIMDTKNVGFYRASRATGTLQLLDALTEPNFPEIAGPIFIIQVPHLVSGVWRICQAFLDPAVAAKITVDSGLPTKELLKHMDEDVLFEELGGTNRTVEFPKAEYT